MCPSRTVVSLTSGTKRYNGSGQFTKPTSEGCATLGPHFILLANHEQTEALDRLGVCRLNRERHLNAQRSAQIYFMLLLLYDDPAQRLA
jgi:hypothetical protein